MKRDTNIAFLKVIRGIILVFSIYSSAFLGWAIFELASPHIILGIVRSVLAWTAWFAINRTVKATDKLKFESSVLATIGLVALGFGIYKFIELRGAFIMKKGAVYEIPIIYVTLGVLLLIAVLLSWQAQNDA